LLFLSSATAQADITERVSVSASGAQGNGASFAGGISSDGDAVVFQSFASNLVAGDTNGFADVFVRDRQAGTTERVSLGTSGQQGIQDSTWPAISGDGRFAAFTGEFDLGELREAGVFVRDRPAAATERVTFMNGFGAALSGDGRIVAFAGDSVDGVTVVVDRETDAIAFFPARGFSLPGVSADGRFVTYMSRSTDRIGEPTGFPDGLVVADVQSRAVEQLGDAFFLATEPVLNADGRFVAFETMSDIFVFDRASDVVERVSVNSAAEPANAPSSHAALSADGRFVAFASFASNLVPGDTNGAPDVFVHDRETGLTDRVSLTVDGTQGNGASEAPELSGDGRTIAFSSTASNLVPGDTNGVSDTFVRVRSNPEDQIVELIATVADSGLPPGIERQLTRALQGALDALGDGDPATSPCPALERFLHKARRFEPLSQAGREIASSLGC
jgi:Tol biopolymer transport system component